jgi:hypothetical protein
MDDHQWIEQLRQKMTDVANEHHKAMLGMSEKAAADYVKRTIAAGTIVFGVYQDPNEPSGIGMHIIKGRREMQAVIASCQPEQFVFDAIPCTEKEQAIAADQLWGDGQTKSN